MALYKYILFVIKVVLSVPISTTEARGAVEKWLLQVEEVMIKSIRDVIEQAYQVSYGGQRRGVILIQNGGLSLMCNSNRLIQYVRLCLKCNF